MAKGKLPGANNPREFHAFSNFPPELQNMIWRYSLPGPRVIRAKLRSAGYFVFRDALPPTALHVCRSSRQEALRFYELLSESESTDNQSECDTIDDLSEYDSIDDLSESNSTDDLFESDHTDDDQLQDSKSGIPRSRSIYFNPALDTVYLMPDHKEKCLYASFASRFPNIARIRSLAIDFSPGSDFMMDLCVMLYYSEGNLKEILLVVTKDSYVSYNHLDGRKIRFSKPKDDVIPVWMQYLDPPWPWQKWRDIEADLLGQFNWVPNMPQFRVMGAGSISQTTASSPQQRCLVDDFLICQV